MIKKSEVLKEGYIKGLKEARDAISALALKNGQYDDDEIYEAIGGIMNEYESMKPWEIEYANKDNAKIRFRDPQYDMYTASAYFSKQLGKDTVKISADGCRITLDELQCIMRIAKHF